MSEDGSGRCGVSTWIVRLVVFFGVLAPLGTWAWLSLYQYKENAALASSNEALGDQAYSRGDLDAAVVAYEKASIKRNSFYLQLKLAGARMGMLGQNPDMIDANRLAGIEHDVKWLIQQDPSSTPTCLAVRGHMEMIRGRPDQAEARYKESLEKDADNVSGHLGLAILYKAKGKRTEAAREYETVVARLPGSFNALMALAELRLDLNDAAGSLELLDKALAIKTDWQAHLLKGLAYTRSKDAENAEKEYVTTVRLNPKSFDAYAALGNLYFGSKMYDRAKEAFSNALKIRNDEGIAAGLAAVFNEMKLPNDCLRVLNPYLRSGEAGPGPLTIAAKCSEALKQPEQARALYTAALMKIKELGDRFDKKSGEALGQAAQQGLDRLKEGSK